MNANEELTAKTICFRITCSSCNYCKNTKSYHCGIKPVARTVRTKQPNVEQ
ncbi:hypothetical protein F511_04666 [Dorcoceras hygrometricum]|uniref:Uncharacterized protein n=1 Tax=Dorcoceras hygrometricum TaxID=472368 RepID=A0A2Z7B0F7_9LAMI|nr:hypothetical protein F511_04666 [Dorcoceras hygrometricum]